MDIDINIESQVSQTITDGVTNKAPSENAVFDALSLKIGGAVSIGQVAFGTASGVIGGDAGLFWDNVNKRLGVGATPATNVRLDVRAQGELSTDIAFRVRNSADTLDIIRATGEGSVFIGLGAGNVNTGVGNTANGINALRNNTTGTNNTANGVQALGTNTTGSNNTANGVNALRNNTTGGNNTANGVNAGRYIADGVTSNTITNNSVYLGNNTKALADNQSNQIVIGFDAIGLGSNSSVIGNSSTTLFRPYGNVAIGADTAGARLDVRAQGSLSTDVAFRVRNSADNDNIISIKGNRNIFLLGETQNGRIELSATGGNATMKHVASAVLPSLFKIQSSGSGGSIGQIQFDAFDGLKPAFTIQRLISGLSDLTGSTLNSGFGTNAATFVMKNALNYGGSGIIPTGTAADHFAMYSDDITAGNAAPHFRTENGSVIKLYQETTAIAPSTLVTNLGVPLTDTDTFDGYTLKQVVKALKNLGILA